MKRKLFTFALATLGVLSVFMLLMIACKKKEAPAAPTEVSSYVSGSTIVVQWGAVEGADSYLVTDGNGNNLGGVTALSYVDHSPKQGMNKYRVYAENQYGRSSSYGPTSCYYEVNNGGGSTVSAPTGVSAQVSGSRVCVTWNAVSNASYYRVYWASSSSCSYSVIASSNNSTTYYDASPSTYNYYKVTAVSSSGVESEKSSYAYCYYSGGGGGGSTISAPTGVSAQVSGSRVCVTWNAVSNASYYRVYWASSSSGSYSVIASSNNSTTYYDASPSTYNYYKVTAVSSSGVESEKSSYAYCYYSGGGGGGGTSSPCPPTVSISGTSSQTVSWTVSTSSGCGTPTSYEVYHLEPCDSEWVLMTTTTSRSYSVPSSYINPGVNRYAVKAINSAGSSTGYGTSSEVSLAKPSSFNVQKLGNDGIKFTWSSVAKATGYQVHYCSSANGSYYIYGEYDAPLTEQICSFPGYSGTTYYFKIRAKYSCGTSPVYSDFTTYKSVTF